MADGNPLVCFMPYEKFNRRSALAHELFAAHCRPGEDSAAIAHWAFLAAGIFFEARDYYAKMEPDALGSDVRDYAVLDPKE